MSHFSEYVYRLTGQLPPSVRDARPLKNLRDNLRLREVIRRTAPWNEKAAYRQEIESESMKVIFISPWYRSFPLIAVSMLEQTYHNWELHLIHDGPVEGLSRASAAVIESDERIRVSHTDARANDTGHTPREVGLDRLNDDDAEWVVITGSDNYHVPGYIRQMLETADDQTDMLYCDMIHDYFSWRHFETRLEYSFVDCGCVMARLRLARKVRWREKFYHADWSYIQALMRECGSERIRKVPAPLFVHN